ncbi:MAG: glutathione S-transferase [Phycisphaerae bacterium]|nr:MAG: glutathione S-transferase [Phycisphaerae bacterium]
MILYGADLSCPSNKVRFVLHCLGLKYEYRRVNLRAGEHRRPEFLQKNPIGKIPVLEDGDFVLAESNAIARYLCEAHSSPLYPRPLKSRARVEQWLDFGSLHIGAAMNRIVFNRIFAPRIGEAVDEASVKTGEKFLNRFLPVVENQILKNDTRTLLPEGLTLADLNLLSILDPAEAAGIDLEPYPALSEWRQRLMAQEFYRRCHTCYTDVLQSVLGPQAA